MCGSSILNEGSHPNHLFLRSADTWTLEDNESIHCGGKKGTWPLGWYSEFLLKRPLHQANHEYLQVGEICTTLSHWDVRD